MHQILPLLWRSSAAAIAVFALLWGWDRLMPQTFASPVGWWLLPILFAVHALPRALFLLAGSLRRRRVGA